MPRFIGFDVEKVPRYKVELHAHLEGSVRLSTVWELAEKKGIDPQVKCLEDLFDCCSIKTPSTLANFLKPFSLFVPIIAGDAEAIQRVAYEFCEDAVRQGILYSEVRYCPHLLSSKFGTCSKSDLFPRDVVVCVNKGLSRGAAQFHLTIRSILCCFRPNPEWSAEILELCTEFRHEGVVGIDVAGDEAVGFADAQIVAVFQKAASLGIHRTAHAGEAGPADNVRLALENMMAERIGHGYHVTDDHELYASCLDRHVHFETCPYSSCLTGSVPLSDTKHPIVRFAEDNANFSISRDDPTVVQKTLDEEYELLRGYGLKDVHFTKANFNAARSCFLLEDEKRLLLQQLGHIYSTQEENKGTILDYIPTGFRIH